MIKIIYKGFRKIFFKGFTIIDFITTIVRLAGNGVKFSSFRSNGCPYVMVAMSGKMKIGADFAMNNNVRGNPIGCFQPCLFFVDNGAEIIIGNHVGISQTTLVSHCRIEIQDYVKIGGGTRVYTTDFHSLDPQLRASSNDMRNRISRPVTIMENAFIGAHCIILKGVTIGRNSIIGAGSVITKSIPDNEIWAGNPAKFIRKISCCQG